MDEIIETIEKHFVPKSLIDNRIRELVEIDVKLLGNERYEVAIRELQKIRDYNK